MVGTSGKPGLVLLGVQGVGRGKAVSTGTGVGGMSKKRKANDPAELACSRCGSDRAWWSNPVREGRFVVYWAVCSECKLRLTKERMGHVGISGIHILS